MKTIVFTPAEYTRLPDECVAIQTTTIRAKLPSKTALSEALDTQTHLDTLREQMTAQGVNLSIVDHWLQLHGQGQLSARRYLATLQELDRLCRQYGVGLLHQALLKITAYDDAGKCTLPYLRTVLTDLAAKTVTPPQPLKPLPANEADAWIATLTTLQHQLNAPSFDTWLRPVVFLGVEAERLRLSVPTETHQYWLEEYYSQKLLEIWNQQGQSQIQMIEWVVRVP